MHRPDHITDVGRPLETDAMGNINTPLGNLTAPEQQTNYNPTNPNPYQFNWDQNTINPYIQQGSPINNPAGQNQIQFLSEQGIDVTGLDESSLAFLPSMDRLNTAYNRMNTQVGMARTGLGFDLGAQQLSGQQNLLNMTGGMGLSSMGSGFGAQGRNMASNLANTNQAYQTGLNQSMAGFQSDILGMQYDYQDAQTDYQNALTTALGNLMASGEDQFNVAYTGNTAGTNSVNQNDTDEMTDYYDSLYG